MLILEHQTPLKAVEIWAILPSSIRPQGPSPPSLTTYHFPHNGSSPLDARNRIYIYEHFFFLMIRLNIFFPQRQTAMTRETESTISIPRIQQPCYATDVFMLLWCRQALNSELIVTCVIGKTSEEVS